MTGGGHRGNSARDGLVAAAVVIVVGLAPFMMQMLRSSMALLTSTLEREFGVSAMGISIISGAFWLGILVTTLPGAILVARLGPRLVTLWFGLLMAAGTGWFALAQSPLELSAARFVMGLGAGPLMPAALAMLAAGVDPAKFRRLSGEVTLMARLGTLAATGPLAALALWVGWREALGSVGIVVAVVTVLSASAMGRAARPTAEAGSAPDAVRLWPPRYLANGAVAAMTALSAVIGGVVFTVVGLWGAPWLATVYGQSTAAQAVVLTGLALAYSVGAVLAPVAASRLGRATVGLYVGCACGLLAVAALDLVPHALLAPYGVALGLSLSPTALLIAEIREALPRALQAVAVSLVPFAFGCGTVLFQVGSGLLVDAFPGGPGDHPPEAFRTLFGTFAALLALTGSWYIFARRSAAAR